jgi:CxxC motif-containing protein
MKKELICIICPMGCRLETEYDAEKIVSVRGNECPRGKEYAAKEIFHPERIVTTTVHIRGASIPVLPVKTSLSVPKDLGPGIVRAASKITIDAPIGTGDIIIRNILGTGANLVATRTAERA